MTTLQKIGLGGSCHWCTTLIEIHFHTHSCTSDHSMRSKYRSAVYAFTDEQHSLASQTIEKLQAVFVQV